MKADTSQKEKRQDIKAGLPAVGFLGLGQGVVEEGVSLVSVLLRLQPQLQVSGDGHPVISGRLAVVSGRDVGLTFALQRAGDQAAVTVAPPRPLHSTRHRGTTRRARGQQREGI